ncbi:efflux RND transporter periplasmic adaptor subunit [Undibacterium squillarum]|uniref:efflux RND transporter periplasmic adaptor subunit n=1 Tax=Undibacterium squillarum TaxID=1131567 RepID=UPI0035B1CE3C
MQPNSRMTLRAGVAAFRSAVQSSSWRKLALVLPVAVLAACGQQQQGGPGMGKMPPPEVSVVTVQARDLDVDYEYVGQTAGLKETEIRARVPGILENRLYEEGARVKAGTVLFQIDPGTYQTQLAAAEASLGVAEAKLNQAKREFARLSPLAADKAISQKEMDDAKSALELADASYKQVKAQVAEAKLNLSYTKVVAPIDGVTGTAAKSNGNLITAADNLLTTIVQTDQLYVNFSIPEADYLKVAKEVGAGKVSVPGKRAANGSIGFDVKLKLADGSMFAQTGKMNFVSEKITTANGGFDARAIVANPDGSLRPGQFVRVILSGAKRQAALAVPQRAVIDSPMGKMVFAVSPDNKLVPKPVELDGWSHGEWIVTKGINAGDRVLVDGFIKAHDPGMTVTPVPLSAKEAAALPANPSAPAAAQKQGAQPAASASAQASAQSTK